MTLAEFLKHVKAIAAKGGRNRIVTADGYLKTLAKCSGGLCPTDRARYTGPEFEKRVKEAASIPVYRNDFCNFVSFNKSGLKAADADTNPRALAPIASIQAIYTSTKEDRDSDILEAGGAEIDPKMPSLWQHDSTSPIGAHREVLSQDKSKVLGRFEIADTLLGRDAAYLAEFGALRISHGFRPREFEPITEKSGGHEIVTGFHVLKYEMMEISLVSVPSNTDAVIEAFHRAKLASPMAKSWGKSLDEHRQRFFTTGFGVKAMKMPAGRTVVGIKRIATTGVKRVPKPRKEAADTEKALADACGQIVHSGDYGLCFYRPAQDEAMVDVYWTMGDADSPDNTDESGKPYTSADDIKSLLGGVAGVASVEIGSEANPPYNEGWRQVYPEVRDWTDEGADKPQPADATQSSEPPPAGSDDSAGKGGKGKRKDGAPVAGSAEHVAMTLAPLVGPYLAQNGAAVEEGAEPVIQATYPDSVIVRVGGDADGTGATYYRVGYTLDGEQNPSFTGTPEQVELQTIVTDAPAQPGAPGADGTTPPATPPAGDGSTPPDSGTGGAAGAAGAKPQAKGKKTVQKWVKVKPKGKIGKKDTGLLKEAQEHLDDAMSDGRKMPTVCKTLVRRAADLIGDVMKSDGSDAQDGNGSGGGSGTGQQQQPAVLADGQERNLWAIAVKMVGNKDCSKTALAAILTELATTLEASDVSQLLSTLGK
jgi:HK97 family phage prohead protease